MTSGSIPPVLLVVFVRLSFWLLFLMIVVCRYASFVAWYVVKSYQLYDHEVLLVQYRTNRRLTSSTSLMRGEVRNETHLYW